MVVVVSEEGTDCDPRSLSFQPMTPAQLVRHGIVKQHRLNFLPDWGVIVGVYHHCQRDIFVLQPLGIQDCEKCFAGVLSLLLLAVTVVTITVLVLQPCKAKLVSQLRTKPKWRSLGEPFCPVDCSCSRDGYIRTEAVLYVIDLDGFYVNNTNIAGSNEGYSEQ